MNQVGKVLLPRASGDYRVHDLHCLPHDRLTLRLLKMNDMETGLKLSGSISQ